MAERKYSRPISPCPASAIPKKHLDSSFGFQVILPLQIYSPMEVCSCSCELFPLSLQKSKGLSFLDINFFILVILFPVEVTSNTIQRNFYVVTFITRSFMQKLSLSVVPQNTQPSLDHTFITVAYKILV